MVGLNREAADTVVTVLPDSARSTGGIIKRDCDRVVREGDSHRWQLGRITFSSRIEEIRQQGVERHAYDPARGSDPIEILKADDCVGVVRESIWLMEADQIEATAVDVDLDAAVAGAARFVTGPELEASAHGHAETCIVSVAGS